MNRFSRLLLSSASAKGVFGNIGRVGGSRLMQHGARVLAVRGVGTTVSSSVSPSRVDLYHDSFHKRHMDEDADNIKSMLSTVGVKSIDELIDRIVPESIRRSSKLDVGVETGIHEKDMLNYMSRLAAANDVKDNFIGAGYYGTITPSVIRRNLFENPGWYTSYTPYQAEVSQGRLESLLNFQTVVTDLTGMEISTASLLDEGTAAAEAMALCVRLHNGGRVKFFASQDLHPQTLEVLKTRAVPLGFELIVGSEQDLTKLCQNGEASSLAGALLSYPHSTGRVVDPAELKALLSQLKPHKVHTVVASDLLALTLLPSPGELGADIVVGSAQRFGVPMGFGGPHAGFLAAKQSHARSLPGRIIGVSVDSKGRPALRMALQTREQHIRRDKATSNICTAQALLANMAAAYAVFHGPEGLKRIATYVHSSATYVAKELEKLGFVLKSSHFFDTVHFALPENCAVSGEDFFQQLATIYNINVRRTGPSSFAVSCDETHHVLSTEHLVNSCANILQVMREEKDLHHAVAEVSLPSHFARQSLFLQQKVFQNIRTETEMMRYLKYLQDKDVALDRSMIALGSCTMKLNPATTLQPILEEGFANLHPFVPASQATGYMQLKQDLEQMLCSLTELDACSLQPNSGAAGEYAGLLAIRGYLDQHKQHHRKICLIPASAHGTNPASAALAGFKIVGVPSDADGNIDVIAFKDLCVKHKDELACAMITYPSTHGVFEKSIQDLTAAVHANGGQVYIDGANMNAQVGLTSPGALGADVCHLNLHKTLSIPHGGGGPGVGPICVKQHLLPFLPTEGHIQSSDEEKRAGGAVSSAPLGSAMILPIPFSFMMLLGNEGLKKSTMRAILNANYMAYRLKGAYKLKYMAGVDEHKGKYCAHEFIIDASEFKTMCGVTEEDIAKRLIDFGFHAPTMSFPVPASLMIEPTESESKQELDRFCDAMLQIRKEIDLITKGQLPKDNNPLKNAPHTLRDITVGEWDKPYPREQAAYPLPWVLSRGKYWPTVNRLDNVHGDKNLMCQCGDVSQYTD